MTAKADDAHGEYIMMIMIFIIDQDDDDDDNEDRYDCFDDHHECDDDNDDNDYRYGAAQAPVCKTVYEEECQTVQVTFQRFFIFC